MGLAAAAVPVVDPVELGPLELAVVLPDVDAAVTLPLVLPALAWLWLLSLAELLVLVVVAVPAPLLFELAV